MMLPFPSVPPVSPSKRTRLLHLSISSSSSSHNELEGKNRTYAEKKKISRNGYKPRRKTQSQRDCIANATGALKARYLNSRNKTLPASKPGSMSTPYPPNERDIPISYTPNQLKITMNDRGIELISYHAFARSCLLIRRPVHFLPFRPSNNAVQHAVHVKIRLFPT